MHTRCPPPNAMYNMLCFSVAQTDENVLLTNDLETIFPKCWGRRSLKSIRIHHDPSRYPYDPPIHFRHLTLIILIIIPHISCIPHNLDVPQFVSVGNTELHDSEHELCSVAKDYRPVLF